MSSSLGFVALARRPGQPAEPVSAVFPEYPNGLEQAQNVLESCRAKCPACRHPAHDHGACGWAKTETWRDDVGVFAPPSGMERTLMVGTCMCEKFDPVEYVIGEISERTP